jgi:hypothetical protein
MGAAIVVALLAGCVSSPTPQARPSSSAGQSDIGGDTAAAPVVSTPQAVVSVGDLPVGETILGQLSSQRGAKEVGPYTVPGDQAFAVDAVCVGSGRVEISIPGVGGFPVHCDPDGKDPGVKNVFRMGVVTTVTVRGQGDDSLLWGIAVTAIP